MLSCAPTATVSPGGDQGARRRAAGAGRRCAPWTRGRTRDRATPARCASRVPFSRLRIRGVPRLAADSEPPKTPSTRLSPSARFICTQGAAVDVEGGPVPVPSSKAAPGGVNAMRSEAPEDRPSPDAPAALAGRPVRQLWMETSSGSVVPAGSAQEPGTSMLFGVSTGRCPWAPLRETRGPIHRRRARAAFFITVRPLLRTASNPKCQPNSCLLVSYKR